MRRAEVFRISDCLQQPPRALAYFEGVFDLRRQDSHGAYAEGLRRACFPDGHGNLKPDLILARRFG